MEGGFVKNKFLKYKIVEKRKKMFFCQNILIQIYENF